MELEITVNDKSAVVKVEAMAENMFKNLRVGLQHALIHYRDQVVKNITSGKYGIKTRSGRLRGSLETDIQGSGLDLKGYVGTNLVYAAIHEFGGTIKAKRAPFLVFQIGGNWIRKKRVEMPERGYMRKTLETETDEILRIIAQELIKVV